MEKGNANISYQNKDIISKIWGEQQKNKSFEVYGVNLPRIVDVLQTNLPDIEVTEQRMDNIFLLIDGSYAIIDYESDYSVDNKIKYTGYINRVLKRLRYDGIDIENVVIRMVVIYTADVRRGSTVPYINMGSVRIPIIEGFLSDINPGPVIEAIEHKIKNNELLSEKELMLLVILPLTYRGKNTQARMAEEVANLIEKIDETQQTEAYVGLLGFNDKILDEELAAKIRRVLTMTKVGQMIADEIDAKLKENTEQVTEQVTEQGIEKLVKIFRKMNLAVTDLVENLMSDYNLSEAEAKKKVELYWGK